ncbi:hypothetical protein BpHYR1_049366 [Brachionus plicatilis]|uniref:Uncharacterized protein n=1 Tax=Brachionus plicatilis TaxID=10195 RepID=A0A3M7SR16_BRAPC|nr:hypothetical protein BpHYR1_049366 [Brachionus plicatilis]
MCSLNSLMSSEWKSHLSQCFRVAGRLLATLSGFFLLLVDTATLLATDAIIILPIWRERERERKIENCGFLNILQRLNSIVQMKLEEEEEEKEEEE